MYKITHEIMKNAEWAVFSYLTWMLEREPTDKEVNAALSSEGVWEGDAFLRDVNKWIDSTISLVGKVPAEYFKERDWCAIVNGRYLGLDYGMWEYLTFRAK